MRDRQSLVLVAFQVVLAAAGLIVGVKLLAPHRNPPAVDLPALTVRLARDVVNYRERVKTLRGADTAVVLRKVVIGLGYRITVLSDTAARVETRMNSAECAL